MGFVMIHDLPTHIKGGHIDQVWVKIRDENIHVESEDYSPYNTSKDHDAALVTIFKEEAQSTQVDDNFDEDDRRLEAKRRLRKRKPTMKN